LFCQDLGRKSVRAQYTNIILAKLHKKIIIPNSLGLFGVFAIESAGGFDVAALQDVMPLPQIAVSKTLDFVKKFRIFERHFGLKIHRPDLWSQIRHSREVKNQVFLCKM
jgi:hypothetical protein